MRTITFDPATLTDPASVKWWKAWQKRADKATDQALQRWGVWYQQPVGADGSRPTAFDPGLQQAIWSDLKDWLNENVYYKHCAYCEGPLQYDRYGGDAEHFRPKGRVTVRAGDGSTVIAHCKLPDGSESQHPGYFWLAYDWRNLVPACAFCNSGFGKVDQFPVKATHVFHVDEATAGFAAGQTPARTDGFEVPRMARSYFLPPARLDSLESPLLLNPLNPDPSRDPSKHLSYGVLGAVVALDDSELGNKSIEVYELKREDLRLGRQKAQEHLQLAYYGALLSHDEGAPDHAVRVLAQYKSGQEFFATAAVQVFEEKEARLKKLRGI